ncbi:hypothetical protein RHOFW104T7_03530 [Rhodanobacter thiooxydans]|uniref:Uncharacterized protein n=1 Tax=Rhodanobacter thiooxydans TaxID=416169 RepID=A0A154QCB0_9GAMM|nr:hypothetical protein [Rhodanobacter thiooxydans]EIL98767.1 hypothetical protein UUA_10811 [Rhodanobacter thiooxydans LCS2]KZC21864.1 hypothetical protein RHOFW104T7_03530 [Rhodanobacter thiooxydans]MCW0200244.1 hypothetical protein [Rhodanobacter thiooxydans]
MKSSNQLDTALDAARLSKINSDSTCPIADAHVYVRSGSPTLPTVTAALARFKNQAVLAGCKRLKECAGGGTAKPGHLPAACKSACYSRDEGNCLSQLERSYAIEIKSPTDSSSAYIDALQSEASDFVALLDEVQYQRPGSVENTLAASGVRALSEYLDVLSKVAQGRKSEYLADAAHLSDRLTFLSNKVEEVSGKQLSSSTKETKEQVQTALGAIGKLAGILQTMGSNATSANEIKRLVRENKGTVDGLIQSLRAVALGDSSLAQTYSDLVVRNQRLLLEQKFANARDDYDRRLISAQLENYQYGDDQAMATAINAMFDNLSAANESMVSLVEHPTDEQKKLIANERLQNLKAAVGALVEVAQAVK